MIKLVYTCAISNQCIEIICIIVLIKTEDVYLMDNYIGYRKNLFKKKNSLPLSIFRQINGGNFVKFCYTIDIN